MLIDKVRVDFVSGHGGTGSVNFQKSGKPDGGDGGHGGDVILVGDENIYDLRKFKSADKFVAQDGERGAYNRRTGANGEYLYIKVPLTSKLYDLEGNFITEISEHGQEVVLLKGGAGGKGNYYFRKGQVNTLNKFKPGKPGNKLMGFIELELKADIVFIGLPNAGKSSMLNELTRANTKVADYPFTTLEPFIGVMENLKLMDLPGLIEGTSKGKGLGSNFQKHVKSCRVLAHFLSIESIDIKNDYKIIRKELSDINPELITKPELLVITKTDLVTEKDLSKTDKIIKKFHDNYIFVSVIDDASLAALKQKFIKLAK